MCIRLPYLSLRAVLPLWANSCTHASQSAHLPLASAVVPQHCWQLAFQADVVLLVSLPAGSCLVPSAVQECSAGATACVLCRSFGYLNEKGYCIGTFCHKFPVMLGETGSGFDSLVDIDFMDDLAMYMHNTGGL